MVLAIFEAKRPAADDLRDLVAAALETAYPGFTMLDTRLPVADGVMLILESNGTPRLVSVDAEDVTVAMTNGLQAAEKMQDSRELLCRLYPPLKQAMQDHEVQLTLIVPRVPTGGWAINSRYLQISVFTFLALNVNGEVGLLLEPVAQRDLGAKPKSRETKASAERDPGIEQFNTGVVLENAVQDSPVQRSAGQEKELQSEEVVENELPTTVQSSLGNPLLTDEEEEFFKQL